MERMVGPPMMNYEGLLQLMSGPVASRLHTNLREKWIWPREKGEAKLERGSRGRGRRNRTSDFWSSVVLSVLRLTAAPCRSYMPVNDLGLGVSGSWTT